MADGLPTVPDRPPGELTPRERGLPIPRVEQPQVMVPRVTTPQIETPRVGTLEGGFALLGHALDQAADEGMGVASVMAREAGLRSVTRDADGNIAVTKFPIVGRAAESFRRAMEVRAVAEGQAVVAQDLVDLQQKFRDDPEGFRSAVQAYRAEKVAQYGDAAGPYVSMSLGHAIDMHAVETYRGMLVRQEGQSLRQAASSIGVQVQAAENSLYALALGGKLYTTDDKGKQAFSPEAAAYLQQVTALRGQIASNPRFGVSKDAVDYQMTQLQSELRVADMQYRVGETLKTQGPEAATRMAETIKSDTSLNLTPSERVSSFHRVMADINNQVTVQNANDKAIAKNLGDELEKAARGEVVLPEVKELNRRLVGEASPWGKPVLEQTLQQIEAVQPIMADLRKGTPAGIERFLNDVEQEIHDHGNSPPLEMMRTAGEQLLLKMREGIKSDPLQWSSRSGSVRVPPIDWSAPPPDLMQQMRDRVGKAEAVAQKFGIAPRYLFNDEKTAINAVAQRGGQPLRDIAQTLVEGFGDRAQRALGEVSGESPVLGQIGNLLASGHVAPSFVFDASRAVELRNNPDFKNRFPRWADKESDAIRQDQNAVTAQQYGAAFTLQPNTYWAMQATAQAAYFSRAVDNDYTPKPTEDQNGSKKAFELALQQAAGRTTVGGVNFGGVADYGTKPGTWFKSNRVLVPPDIVSNRFSDVIGALTPAEIAGAVDAKGNPYSVSSFKAAIPVWNGRGYQFSLGDPTGDDPRWIRGSNGRPFELNIDALEPVLRKRVPEAYGEQRHSMLFNPLISPAAAMEAPLRDQLPEAASFRRPSKGFQL